MHPLKVVRVSCGCSVVLWLLQWLVVVRVCSGYVGRNGRLEFSTVATMGMAHAYASGGKHSDR